MEENRLRVLEERVLSRLFGSKQEKVVGSWSGLHNEELHHVMGGACGTHVTDEKCIQNFGRKTLSKDNTRNT